MLLRCTVTGLSLLCVRAKLSPCRARKELMVLERDYSVQLNRNAYGTTLRAVLQESSHGTLACVTTVVFFFFANHCRSERRAVNMQHDERVCSFGKAEPTVRLRDTHCTKGVWTSTTQSRESLSRHQHCHEVNHNHLGINASEENQGSSHSLKKRFSVAVPWLLLVS